jgi:hypothetical protein
MNKSNIDLEIKKIVPGFTMGIVRAAISHPFEMLKLKSQMGISSGFYNSLHKGIHLSILSNSLERGIQFYYFEKFKTQEKTIFNSALFSSLISTSISLPYNITLLRRNVLEEKSNTISSKVIVKAGSLEYNRNIIGSTMFLYTYDNLKSFGFPIYVCSILTSALVWMTTYPIDNIKNQIIASNKITYSLPFLYRGVQYPIIRSIPSSSIGMYVYEYMKQLVENN